MGSHPINLIFRFALELAALFFMGNWGWKQSDSWTKFLLAIGIPLVAVVLWGVFNVPDDPSRSGNAPVPVSGWIRLSLELVFFAFAVWAAYNSGLRNIAWIMIALTALHYLLSYDRIFWLLER